MLKIKNLAHKSISTLKESGIKGLCTKIYRHFKNRHTHHFISDHKDRFVDVMLIDGFFNSVPLVYKQRIDAQCEQLKASNITTSIASLADLEVDDVRLANNFIFYGCLASDKIDEFVKIAKSNNKRVLFDVDYWLINDNNPLNCCCHKLNLDELEGAISQANAIIVSSMDSKTKMSNFCDEIIINRHCITEDNFAKFCSMKSKKSYENIVIGCLGVGDLCDFDFERISPAISKILDSYASVRLLISRSLSVPSCLESYKNRLELLDISKFDELLHAINLIDINVIPLKRVIANNVDLETSWISSSFLKVPTVASNSSFFDETIKHGITGFVCEANTEWEESLISLIENTNLRQEIGHSVFEYCRNNYLSTCTSIDFSNELKSRLSSSVLLDIPGLAISGGIRVALKHAQILKKKGYSVTLCIDGECHNWFEYDGTVFPVINRRSISISGSFDIGIATFWTTADFIDKCPFIRNKRYLVQNYEPDFYPLQDYKLMNEDEIHITCSDRILSTRTYKLNNVSYITISKWCKEWLESKFEHEVGYARNGLDVDSFSFIERNGEKTRILIEGDCSVDYKKVDESFKITNKLDPEKYEIWYMSYNGKPKEWYKCDKFLNRVPFEDVHSVYEGCDILLKSSTLESFSYPPLEMMATGGLVVAVQNQGNSEYLKHEYNCLTYESGNIDDALTCIDRLANDVSLKEKLRTNGRSTAIARDWDNLETEILALYE